MSLLDKVRDEISQAIQSRVATAPKPLLTEVAASSCKLIVSATDPETGVKTSFAVKVEETKESPLPPDTMSAQRQEDAAQAKTGCCGGSPCGSQDAAPGDTAAPQAQQESCGDAKSQESAAGTPAGCGS